MSFLHIHTYFTILSVISISLNIYLNAILYWTTRIIDKDIGYTVQCPCPEKIGFFNIIELISY